MHSVCYCAVMFLDSKFVDVATRGPPSCNTSHVSLSLCLSLFMYMCIHICVSLCVCTLCVCTYMCINIFEIHRSVSRFQRHIVRIQQDTLTKTLLRMYEYTCIIQKMYTRILYTHKYIHVHRRVHVLRQCTCTYALLTLSCDRHPRCMRQKVVSFHIHIFISPPIISVCIV